MTDRKPAAAEAQFTRGQYRISTDRQRFDVELIHGFLSRSYWSPGIPREAVERGIAHSLCFGVFHGTQQVGFARTARWAWASG
jgi:hypothetical protein